MSYILFSEDYLAHHGILGMKWGVRRFQNADGTRTEAGKKRYDKKTIKQARKDAEEYAQAKLSYGEGAGTRTEAGKEASASHKTKSVYEQRRDLAAKKRIMGMGRAAAIAIVTYGGTGLLAASAVNDARNNDYSAYLAKKSVAKTLQKYGRYTQMINAAYTMKTSIGAQLGINE